MTTRTMVGLSLWLACWLGPGTKTMGGESLSLAGRWGFELDRADEGIQRDWPARPLSGFLRLPGSLQEQGHGDLPTVETAWTGDIVDRSFFTDPRYAEDRDPRHFRAPFWLTPTRHYVGAAWYQREVVIPDRWAGKRVVLHLERPHWETTVWVDERRMGSGNSLAVPHEHDLTAALSPGRHRLTLRVDNRMVVPVGVNSHSVSDHTQGNWNGLVGELKLVATEPVWVEDLQMFADLGRSLLTVRVRIGNATSRPGRGTLRLACERLGGAGPVPLPVRKEVDWTTEGATVEETIPLPPGMARWDEFQPALHRLTATVSWPAEGGERAEGIARTFGLREVAVQGTRILVNGRAVFLRGTLECCIFPRTGYPPTDRAAWRRLMQIARDHGLNHLRFHSWTPPRAAFDAADELGMYLYVECPTWANQGTTVGDGRPVDAWIRAEGDRILRAYGNHPSFVLMSYGNEPAGRNQQRWLGDLVNEWKARDARRLYTSGAGWPKIPENDVHVTPDARAYPVRAKDGENAGDYSAFLAKENRPVVSHEIGQYCVFPNLDERRKYSGWLQARNFDIVERFLSGHGLRGQADRFLWASGRLQTLFYKDEIEACLRTPGWAGYELLDLHDFPGQGTALVGVLDPFWGEKGYVSPEEFRRFNGATVPLARLARRVWSNDEEFRATLEVAHFGPADLDSPEVRWELREAGRRVVAESALPVARIPTGRTTGLGDVRWSLARFERAVALELRVRVGRDWNSWNLWVYPAGAASPTPDGVRVAASLDATVLAALQRGERVVLLADPASIPGRTTGRFDPIFWNRMWFPSQPQHTLGLFMDPGHPALAAFPTDGHSDWQWQDLHNRSKPMILDALPAGLRPVVQVIDDWNTCRKLGLVFEARVGEGRLLVCSVDLKNGLEGRPAARQLRRALLEYAAGDRFRPRTRVTPDQVRAVLAGP